MKTYEVWDNRNPKTKLAYPHEVVAIDEDGSESIALFKSEIDAIMFVRAKERCE